MKRSLAHLLPLLGIWLATPLAFGADAGIGPSFKGPIGLQLYSLRAEFAKDVPGTLKRVHDYGIKNVELAGTYNLPPEKFKEMLAAHDLKPISGHFPYDRYRNDPEGIARDAKALGLQYAGCAWINHKDAFDENECRDAAAVFSRAGEVLAKQGIRFFYHIHGYEFQPHGQGTLFDLLMQETKPTLVAYQMDVFWVVHPGQDPVKLLGIQQGPILLPGPALASGPGELLDAGLAPASISPNGLWVAFENRIPPRCWFYRLNPWSEIRFVHLDARVLTEAFTPRSDEFAVATYTSVTFLDTNRWEPQRRFPVTLDRNAQMIFMPDGKAFWLVYDARTAILHDTHTFEKLTALPVGTIPLAASPDGRYLAVSVDARRVQVWDLTKVREQFRELGIDWSN